MTSTFIKKMKEGEFMTRICSVANSQQLAVCADSMFTNSITNQKTTNNQKLFYGNQMIVGILGASEVFTFRGVISIGQTIQNTINSSKSQGLKLRNEIRENLDRIWVKYGVTQPCLITYFWKGNDKFYMYCEEIRTLVSDFGEQKNLHVYSPYGNINEENKHLFQFSCLSMQAGDGLLDNPTLEKVSNEVSPLDIAYANTRKAVENPSIDTVDGPIYGITLDDKGFHIFKEGQLLE